MSKKQKRNFSDTIKYLIQEEWDKLRSGIDNYQDKPIIEMLYAIGIRIGELANLRLPLFTPPNLTKCRKDCIV